MKLRSANPDPLDFMICQTQHCWAAVVGAFEALRNPPLHPHDMRVASLDAAYPTGWLVAPKSGIDFYAVSSGTRPLVACVSSFYQLW